MTLRHVFTRPGLWHVVGARSCCWPCSGLVAARPAAERADDRPAARRLAVVPACWRRSPCWLLMLVTGHAARVDRPGRLGRRSRDEHFHFSGQVRVRPAVGAVRDPVVRAVRHDRGVRQPVHAPRARLSTASSCSTLFLLGMVVASLAGTIETLFAGWELVGLSSALLVAFFQERPAPVQERPVGLDGLPGLGRRVPAGRRGAAPLDAAKATSTS